MYKGWYAIKPLFFKIFLKLFKKKFLLMMTKPRTIGNCKQLERNIILAFHSFCSSLSCRHILIYHECL